MGHIFQAYLSSLRLVATGTIEVQGSSLLTLPAFLGVQLDTALNGPFDHLWIHLWYLSCFLRTA